jgi:hypothetical protein
VIAEMRLVEPPSMRRWRNIAVQQPPIPKNNKTAKSLYDDGIFTVFIDTTAITGLRGEYYIAWKTVGKAYHAADDRGESKATRALGCLVGR